MGHRGTSIDQCYGALRRRPAAFYMFDELCSSQQGSNHRVPKKKKSIPVCVRWTVYGGRSIGIYNILI